jgi:amino acid transporter
MDITDPRNARLGYPRSFLLMRTVIGLIGFLLPFGLMLGDWWIVAGDVPRSSLSAYYHTGVRDLFVGSLFAIAVFLVTYRFFELILDNVLSVVAGLAALGVALLPTDSRLPDTPLQARLGEDAVGTAHVSCAVVFVLSLAVMSWLFARDRKDEDPHPRPHWAKPVHRASAIVIVAAMLYMLANAIWHFSGHAAYWGETAATVAFGVSWLVKADEMHRRVRDERRTAEQPPLAGIEAERAAEPALTRA